MATEFDIVVIGAGIVGSACAVEFSRIGMNVAQVDAFDPGLGATAAGMGHIVVMDDSPAQLHLTHYSRQLWDKLAPALPTSCEYRRTGTLWIAADHEEMEEIVRKHALYSENGVETEILDQAELRQMEPFLSRDMLGALSVPGDGVVYAPEVASMLSQMAFDAGMHRIVGRVVSVGHGIVRLHDGMELKTRCIVLAAGEWSCDLIPELPIKRRKGHLVITDRYPGMVQHQLVELGYLKSAHSMEADSVAFNVQPRSTGQLLIGSSRQYGSESKAVDHQVIERMLSRAMLYMPSLRELSVLRMWTGFRAATPDKLPLIGPWSPDETIYLATGHEGLGITTALATASLLADQFAGREPSIALQPYLPQRASLDPASIARSGAAHV
jgi:glycine/D-amino acid oxidase-like deaminating enzyme